MVIPLRSGRQNPPLGLGESGRRNDRHPPVLRRDPRAVTTAAPLRHQAGGAGSRTSSYPRDDDTTARFAAECQSFLRPSRARRIRNLPAGTDNRLVAGSSPPSPTTHSHANRDFSWFDEYPRFTLQRDRHQRFRVAPLWLRRDGTGRPRDHPGLGGMRSLRRRRPPDGLTGGTEHCKPRSSCSGGSAVTLRRPGLFFGTLRQFGVSLAKLNQLGLSGRIVYRSRQLEAVYGQLVISMDTVHWADRVSTQRAPDMRRRSRDSWFKSRGFR